VSQLTGRRGDGPNRPNLAVGGLRVEDTQGSERCAGPGRRFPRRNLRPTASGGRRTTSLLLVPPRCSPPRESPIPSFGLSPVDPPKRPSPRGCCTDESVLCTRPVATRATLGCSRVARVAGIARPRSNGRCPRREATGSRRRGALAASAVGHRIVWSSPAPGKRAKSAPPSSRRVADVPDRSATAFSCPGDREPRH
jgi:hypothetical protein